MRIIDKARLRIRALCGPSECRVELEGRIRFHLISASKRNFHPVCTHRGAPPRPRSA